MVVIALLMQLLGAVNSQLELELLAREGARAASRSRDPEQAARNIVAELDTGASVTVTVDGLLVTVTVSRAAPTIARITGRSEISATVVMAVEPP